jgi:hypothetical protein
MTDRMAFFGATALAVERHVRAFEIEGTSPY